MFDSTNNNSYPKCGEIWMCNLNIKEGSVQGGYRPVFILSNDKNNTYSTTLNIIPITSKMHKKKIPVHVELWSYQDYGLKAPSTVLVEQITTIPVNFLDKCIGKVTDNKVLLDINRAISIQIPIMQMTSA